MLREVRALLGKRDKRATRIAGSLESQAIQEVQQQRVGFDALSGFIREDQERLREVNLLVDGVDRGRVNAIE